MWFCADVMGPDEYHSPVNNSVYTNIIAAHSMRTAQYAASLIHQTPEEQWNSVASQMYIGFDKSLGYHPEYDNYKRGEQGRQLFIHVVLWVGFFFQSL